MINALHHRSRWVLAVALAVAVLALVAGCGSGGGTSSPTARADAVRARVNGQVVRQSSVDVVQAESRLNGHAYSAAKALNEAIDRELVRQEAVRLGVTATAAQIDARAAQLAKQAGGKDALATVLTQAARAPSSCASASTYGLLREAVQNARYAALYGRPGAGARLLPPQPAQAVLHAGLGAPGSHRHTRPGDRQERR